MSSFKKWLAKTTCFENFHREWVDRAKQIAKVAYDAGVRQGIKEANQQQHARDFPELK